MTDKLPDSTPRATRSARPTSLVQIDPDRPYSVSLASLIASASSSNGSTATTGPKTSSRQIRSAGERGRTTVGGYQNPGPDGAPVAFRGSAPSGPGFWFPPTVLAPVDPRDRAATEEIFGPVVCVIAFDDEADAVAKANDTIYGLSGSVWTRDGAKAIRTARAMECGVISINSNTSVRVATPFGGFKQSGLGRELGPDALDHYTELKNVYYATE